jgi:hypothetical protein
MEATNLTSRWYTTAFISSALKEYLEDNGYTISDEQEEKRPNCDEVITATKLFGKEVIEIKGTLSSTEHLKETEGNKRMKLLTEAVNWISDLLLSPISFFVKHYSDEKSPSLCLPDLDQYRDILEKVREYFTVNNLNLKVYLVNEAGGVQLFYLNETVAHQEEIRKEA